MHFHQPTASSIAPQRRAMRWSLSIGVCMFAGKGLAFLLTGSAAILSDAAESVVHVVAVGFAAYSLWLSHQPPDRNHPYGHEKISFFSAGFEGAMIILAALFIIYESIVKWIAGPQIEQIAAGSLLILLATIVNGGLGWFLVRTGRREGSLILVANGKHVLTDSVTSLGAVFALGLVWLTQWQPFDPLVAIAIAIHILWSGIQLVRQASRGLMDEGDPEIERRLRQMLDEWAATSGGQYHDLRHRLAGDVLWVEVHLLFPGHQELDTAHASATAVEDRIERELVSHRVVVTSHLEPLEQHAAHHPPLDASAAS